MRRSAVVVVVLAVLVLPVGPVAGADLAGARIVVPAGAPVAGELRLDAPIRPTAITASVPGEVAVLTIARADGHPLVTVLVDPAMDAFDDPNQLPNAVNVPGALAAGYFAGFDQQVPAGDYLVYAAATAAMELTISDAAPQDVQVAPTDRVQVGFTVLTPELGVTEVASRITTHRAGRSVTTSVGLVATRLHQHSTLETCVSAAGATCSGPGAGAGQRATRLTPGNAGTGWNAMSWNVFPGTFDGQAVDAYFRQAGVTFFHRASMAGLTFHLDG